MPSYGVDDPERPRPEPDLDAFFCGEAVCELHPHRPWPHDDCPGPGMPPPKPAPHSDG